MKTDRLMFGTFRQNTSPEYKGGMIGYGEVEGQLRHAAFGLNGSVVRLRKGDPCS